MRGIQMMTITPDPFNRLVIGGIIFGFFMCFFINIGMVSGLLPVVGCPLPFLSYGGTALVTWMAAFGMLMAIYSQQKYARGSPIMRQLSAVLFDLFTVPSVYSGRQLYAQKNRFPNAVMSKFRAAYGRDASV